MDRATFLKELEQSGLLADVRIHLALQDPGTAKFDGKSLARSLLKQDLLTAYQANLLLSGRTKELALGPYRLLERLGEGGMGQVFKARHQRMDRVVALKVIRKELLTNAEAVRRFHREVRAAAQLLHPNIVVAYDADQVGNINFFAMEYVEGTTLDKLVKDTGPLPLELACHCIYQAALGLQHAHERGLIHRDLKPSNLLLQSLQSASTSVVGRQKILYGTVKLLDFGLVRFHEGTSTGSSSGSHVSKIMGTPDYMAPEQARDTSSANHLSDIYSLGATLYFCLTAQPPFPGGTPLEKLLKHQFDEPVPVERVLPDVTPHLAQLVRKLMAKDPAKRAQTADEVAAILEKWQQAPTVVVHAPMARLAPVVTSLTSSTPEESPQATFYFAPADARLMPRAGSRRRAGRGISWVWWAAAGVVGVVLFIVLLVVTGKW